MTMPYMIETNERIQHLITKNHKINGFSSKGKIEKIFSRKLTAISSESGSVSYVVDIALEEIDKSKDGRVS